MKSWKRCTFHSQELSNVALDVLKHLAALLQRLHGAFVLTILRAIEPTHHQRLFCNCPAVTGVHFRSNLELLEFCRQLPLNVLASKNFIQVLPFSLATLPCVH